MRLLRGIEVLETTEEVVDPKHTVVIVIDVQNDEASPKGAMAQHGYDIGYMRRILAPLAALLDAARESHIPIIYTLSTKSSDGRFETGPSLRSVTRKRDVGVWDYKLEGTWGWEAPEELSPRPEERRLVKYHSSAFVGTPLDMWLRGGGTRTAVVAGTKTEGCVEATVRSLQDHGYYPVIVSDCVTSRFTDLHDAALKVMSGRWDVVTSDWLINQWRSQRSDAVEPGQRVSAREI